MLANPIHVQAELACLRQLPLIREEFRQVYQRMGGTDPL